ARLTGLRPFTGKNVRQLALQHMQGEPDLRSLSEAERPVVARALSKDPDQRFANCVAFVRALRKAVLAMRQEATKTAEQIDLNAQKPKTMPELIATQQVAVQFTDDEVDLASPHTVASVD